MIDKGSDGVILVPIKTYEVESKTASKYGKRNYENYVTSENIPVAQEVVIQTKESVVSASTQTEVHSPKTQQHKGGFIMKSTSSKPNTSNTTDSLRGHSERKSLCSNRLRDFIEELSTFMPDEDDNIELEMEANSESDDEGGLSKLNKDLEEPVLEGNIVCKKTAIQDQRGEHVGIGSSQSIDNDESKTQNAMETPTTEKVFEFDEELGKYKCSGCHKFFKTRKTHQKVNCAKPKTINADLHFDKETQRYKCDECDKTFASKTSFLSHKRNICNKAPQHECIFCDFKGRSPIVVRVHCGKKHGKWPRLLRNGSWVYE